MVFMAVKQVKDAFCDGATIILFREHTAETFASYRVHEPSNKGAWQAIPGGKRQSSFFHQHWNIGVFVSPFGLHAYDVIDIKGLNLGQMNGEMRHCEVMHLPHFLKLSKVGCGKNKRHRRSP